MADPALRLLLVEDHPGDARLFRELLVDGPLLVEVLHRARLRDALEELARAPIDVVMLDLSLPDASGLEAVRRVHRARPSVPLIVLTGFDDEKTALGAMEAGAQDYLIKGRIDGEGLSRAIRYAIQRHQSDVIERQLATEQAARAHAEIAERRFRGLAESIPQIVWEAGADGVIGYTSQRFHDFTGAAPSKQPLDPNEFIHPEDKARALDEWEEARRTRSPWQAEYRLRRHDGAYRWHLGRAVPVIDAEGEVTRWCGTATDIDERKQAEAERQRLYELAQRAVRARDDVLATVSHDLRNPLGTIVLAADLVREQALSQRDAVTVKQAQLIVRAARRMEGLISDLLDIATIESGHLSLRPAPTAVGPLLAEAMEAAQATVAEKGVKFEGEASDPAVEVNCDKDRVLQVLANAIGNAVKFTPAPGTIRVGARRDGAFVRFSVADTGPGIPPDQLPHVFDRFWKGGDSSRAGRGLGLAISRGIVEQHGGTIEMKNRDGGGATLSFTLPVRS